MRFHYLNMEERSMILQIVLSGILEFVSYTYCWMNFAADVTA